MTPYTKIALLGATGTLGPFILRALLSADPPFQTTVLVRPNSSRSFPPSTTRLPLPSPPTHAALVALLRGHDALICAVSGSEKALQIQLADAAFEAGVKLFVPADFGSCDSADPLVLERLDLYRAKAEVRTHLEGLVERGKRAEGGRGREFGWSSLVCGHFFDTGFREHRGLLGIDVEKRKAFLYDSGGKKWSASTRERIGEAVVRILRAEGEKGEWVRNRLVYVQSFCVSQSEVLDVIGEVLDVGGWEVEEPDSGELIEELKRRVEETGDGKAREQLVGVMGIVDADWRGKKNFAMDVLGLDDENLETAVRKAVLKP